MESHSNTPHNYFVSCQGFPNLTFQRNKKITIGFPPPQLVSKTTAFICINLPIPQNETRE